MLLGVTAEGSEGVLHFRWGVFPRNRSVPRPKAEVCGMLLGVTAI
jgi:hypothetical protein